MKGPPKIVKIMVWMINYTTQKMLVFFYSSIYAVISVIISDTKDIFKKYTLPRDN